MPPLPTIACKECGHVNEGERVYCHNCGAKLDRSVLLTVKQQKETPEQKQRRIKKAMSPTAGLPRILLKALAQAVAAGAIMALILDLVLPPPGVPPMPKKGEFLDILQLDLALENLAMAPAGVRISMKEAEINAYLNSKVRLKYDGNIFQSATAFQRTFVRLASGQIQITMQTALLDYPLYFSARYGLHIDSIRNAKGEVEQGVVATPLGASIGRLHLPAQVVEYAGYVFEPLWNSLNREHRLLDHVGSIDIRRDEIVFSAAGPSSASHSGTGAAQPMAPASALGKSTNALGKVPSLVPATLAPSHSH